MLTTVPIELPYHRNDIDGLASLVQPLAPRAILDIGTENAASMFLWFRLAHHAARIISVAWPGESHSDDTLLRYHASRKRSQHCILVHRARDFADVAHDLDQASGSAAIDLLFIDGRRPLPQVRDAYQQLRRRVRRGGVIAWDGVNPHAALPDEADGGDGLWLAVRNLYQRRTAFLDGADRGRGGIVCVRC